MKLSESSDPQTKDGLASGVGDGKGGREGPRGALIGEPIAEVVEEAQGGRLLDDEGMGCTSITDGEEGTTGETLERGAEASMTGARAGKADLGAMFEQQPFLDGKQLVQCRLALAQTQFLHLPPPLQRQHCGFLISRSRRLWY